ncbi:MAG: glycine/D-amino acid oxidase-like deaminating enzyme [Pseudoalteromonas tetraodonis]|jgi:glycine/D-amino acid oxidase-like deaminating enzyme
MPNAETDFLIIGQGLAGSILSIQLIEKGYSVTVLDNSHHASSSVVAAGIINPITGHRLNITERFHKYYSVAERFYHRYEQTHGLCVFKLIEQIRLIKNAGQFEYSKQRLTCADYQGLIERCDSSLMHDQGFGALRVNKTAVVDVQTLLSSLRDYLLLQQRYFAKKVVYDSIEITQYGVQLGEIQAKNLVFCEGHQAINNPWLKSLPFKLSKGEILKLRLNAEQQPTMFNWGNWLICEGNSAKLGSSYEWNDLGLSSTQEVKDKLVSSFESTTKLKAEVLEQQAGIRPTTLHRRPFIGLLSNTENVYCFNGFGSKGCLTIPYYASIFTDCIDSHEPFPIELSKWL